MSDRKWWPCGSLLPYEADAQFIDCYWTDEDGSEWRVCFDGEVAITYCDLLPGELPF